jgi:hypothetical protein
VICPCFIKRKNKFHFSKHLSCGRNTIHRYIVVPCQRRHHSSALPLCPFTSRLVMLTVCSSNYPRPVDIIMEDNEADISSGKPEELCTTDDASARKSPTLSVTLCKTRRSSRYHALVDFPECDLSNRQEAETPSNTASKYVSPLVIGPSQVVKKRKHHYKVLSSYTLRKLKPNVTLPDVRSIPLDPARAALLLLQSRRYAPVTADAISFIVGNFSFDIFTSTVDIYVLSR